MLSEWPVLIVSGEIADQDGIADFVSRNGLRPVCCSGSTPAKAWLARERFSMICCSDHLPHGHLLDVIRDAQEASVEIPVIVVSRFADWHDYLRAIDAGAFDYITLPEYACEVSRILMAALDVTHVLERRSRAAAVAA